MRFTEKHIMRKKSAIQWTIYYIGCSKINAPNFEKWYLKNCLTKYTQISDSNDIIQLKLLLRILSWYIVFSGFDIKKKNPSRKNKYHNSRALRKADGLEIWTSVSSARSYLMINLLLNTSYCMFEMFSIKILVLIIFFNAEYCWNVWTSRLQSKQVIGVNCVFSGYCA